LAARRRGDAAARTANRAVGRATDDENSLFAQPARAHYLDAAHGAHVPLEVEGLVLGLRPAADDAVSLPPRDLAVAEPAEEHSLVDQILVTQHAHPFAAKRAIVPLVHEVHDRVSDAGKRTAIAGFQSCAVSLHFKS
jgi:hypothetical protein